MPGMTLNMQFAQGQAQDLPAHLDYIDTGEMGACVSVIVAWGRTASGRMAHMRGYHGAGGLAQVNFASLFQGVANDPTTKVWMVSGDDNRYYQGMSGFKAHRDLLRHELLTVAQLGHVIEIRHIHRCARARIDRFGAVQH